MPTEDHKYQVVRDDEKDYPSEGEWEYFVHDCHTPSLSEIQIEHAAVGTIWKCGFCSNRWKLINHSRRGTVALMDGKTDLSWCRITPIREEGENK